jgi:pimeloyl-ACP methyl ester carboxylesterase
MKAANVNGVELEYEEQGSGEPVLLIGTGPIADSFLPFFSQQALAERYRLIRYHQRGQRGSTPCAAPVSFEAHAADAVALLESLGIRRAHVAGHSTGAAITLQMAVDNPEIVHTLTLLEPPLVQVPSAAAFFEKAGPALARYGAGDREAAMATFLSVVCSLDWETCCRVIDARVPGGVAHAMADADTFFGSYLPALDTWRFGAEDAAAITQPVLSVRGTESESLFTESDVQLRSWLPRAEPCTIEGAAHLLHLQQPEPVVQGVAAFLAQHPLSGEVSAARRSARVGAASPVRSA